MRARNQKPPMTIEAIAGKLLVMRQTQMDRVITRLLNDGARHDDIEIQYHPDCVRIICWNEKVAEYSLEATGSKITLHGYEKTPCAEIYSTF